MLKEILEQQGERQRLVSLEADAKVSEAARLMAERDVGCVLVMSNRKPRGLITDRDIVVRCVARNLDVSDTTIENVMTESLETCRENDGIYDCILKMEKAGVRRIPVVDSKGEAVGIISFGDLLKVLSKELAHLVHTTTSADRDEMFERLAAA